MCLAFCAPAAAAQAQRWVAGRDLVIGTAQDGPTALTEVTDIVIGRDGAVYLAQPQEQIVRVFDAGGRPLRTIGRRGSGPAEFNMPQDLGGTGDTLVVSDPSLQKLVGFATDGRGLFVASVAALRRFNPRALLSDGRVLGNTVVPSSDIEAGRVRYEEWRVAVRPAVRDASFTRYPFGHHTAHVTLAAPTGNLDGYFRQPFGDSELFDVDPAGRWMVLVSRPVPVSGRRASYTVRRLSLSGRVAWQTEVPYVPAALSPAVVNDTAAAYARMLTDVAGGSEQQRQALATVRRALFTPAYIPAPSRVVAGRDGTTWVRGRSTSRTVTWTVLGNSGRVLAQVDLPSQLDVQAADSRAVWGVVKDADGVPFVHRYRIRGAR